MARRLLWLPNAAIACSALCNIIIAWRHMRFNATTAYMLCSYTSYPNYIPYPQGGNSCKLITHVTSIRSHYRSKTNCTKHPHNVQMHIIDPANENGRKTHTCYMRVDRFLTTLALGGEPTTILLVQASYIVNSVLET